MKNQQSTQSPIQEDEAFTELSKVLPAADRVRFAALGRVSSFAAAKQKSLLRQEKALVARYGPNSDEAKRTRQHLETEKRFEVSARVETQRTQAEDVSRNPEALTLRGRVTNPQRLALPGLTVSAMDEQGQPVVSAASNDTGYFALTVPADEKTAGQNVTLLVSDENKAVFYRGCECFAREPGKIFYRELVIGTADPETQPTPPDDIDPKSVTVPDVRGLEENTARAQIRAVGLSVESSTKEADQPSAGRVIDQTPKPGAKVAPCSLVNIVVGVQEKVAVPNVVGQTLREAQATLKKADLAVGKVDPAGASLRSQVVQQSPAAGEQVAPPTSVDLVTQEPLPQVTVPNVVKLKLASARKTIIKASLIVGETNPQKASDDSNVVEQSPAGGTKADTGSPVNLLALEPTEKVVVPNVVKLSLSDVRSALENAKLTVGPITPSDATAQSVVVKQAPSAGAEVGEGAPIDLEVKTQPNDQPKPKKKSVTRGAAKKTKSKTSGSKKAKIKQDSSSQG